MPNILLYIWFVLVGLSVIAVAWNEFTNNPNLKVMKWSWLLVTLYTGPLALVLYWLSCKEPGPGQHEAFIQPLWKQGVGSF